MSDFNLGDIPDLSGLGEATGPKSDPLADGWYGGTILGRREFTDKNGNDRVFESNDTPAQRSDSRNIRLQIQLTRKSDGKQFNIGYLVNYRPTDLTSETVQLIAKQKDEVSKNGAEWGPLFRSYMTLQRLAKLQKIAGVKQFQRTTDGGLDLSPLFGKSAFFRVSPDKQNAAYKQIDDLRVEEPTRVPVL